MNGFRSSISALLLALVVAGCGVAHQGTGASTATTGGTGGSGGGGSSVSAGGAAGSGGAGGTSASGSSAATSTTGTSASSSSGMASSPPCPCFDGNGAYCETVAEAYATSHQCSVGTATSSDLLSCSDASWSIKASCPGGCMVEQGMPDQCAMACDGVDLAAFIAKFTGVCTGYPGWSPSNQCTDLALQWVANLCLPVQFTGNAVDWAGEPAQGFTWVENAPGIVPSPGDLVVFGPVGMSCDDGVGSAGHVDICVSASATSSDWQGFDQNWSTDWNGTCYPPQLVNHNWGECVIGWQHLTAPIP